MQSHGKCLCGAVTLALEYQSNEIAACHCSMCLTWNGGPILTVDCADSVTFSGEENIKRYVSSDWGERGFCKECGTHLFYYLKPANQYHVPVGLFQTETDFDFTHQIFIDEKPQYYEFKNKTHTMTGAEVFAHYDAGE